MKASLGFVTRVIDFQHESCLGAFDIIAAPTRHLQHVEIAIEARHLLVCAKIKVASPRIDLRGPIKPLNVF